MNSRILWALLFSASAVSAQAQSKDKSTAPVASVAAPTSASAAAKPARPDSTRSFDTQSLRFETSWGKANIIRGANGPVVGTVGWFRRFDVEKMVESSPNALEQVKIFTTNNFRGSLVSALGAVTVGVGILVAGNNANNAATPMVIIAGGGAIGWGLHHIDIGYAALSKSLWWYNRDIAR
jgi:hypothetical protein